MHPAFITCCFIFFFFNDTATTEIYTLSLHDALPICSWSASPSCSPRHSSRRSSPSWGATSTAPRDRKSTRLNSSHGYISYAVFCLKKKKRLSHLRRRPVRVLVPVELDAAVLRYAKVA